MTTPVIFRRFKDKGDLIAIFPTIPGTNDPATCMSYQRVGQHGSCNPAYLVKVTTTSDPLAPDRISLLAELISIGYDDLVVRQRASSKWRQVRKAALKEMDDRVDGAVALAAMRALGVIWRKGRLPLYPKKMTMQQKAQADKIYDAMPDWFIDEQCTKGITK